MSETLVINKPELEPYDRLVKDNDDLVYIPIGESIRPKSEQEIYNESVIDRENIHNHAVYAAKNAARPLSNHEEVIDIVKERNVRFGPFGLFSKTDKYCEKSRIQVPDDFWILESRFLYKREVNGDDEIEEYQSYKYCLHKDGHLFHRTEQETIFIDRKLGHARTVKDAPEDRRLTDYDIITLDYSQKYTSSNDDKGGILNCNWDRGNLIYKKKGEGLIALIDKLIE